MLLHAHVHYKIHKLHLHNIVIYNIYVSILLSTIEGSFRYSVVRAVNFLKLNWIRNVNHLELIIQNTVISK